MPSIDWSSSICFELLSFSFLHKSKKFSIFEKCLAITLAFSCPIWRIPSEKIKRSIETFLLFSIEFFKLIIDFSPQPSILFKTLKSKLKISYGYLINFFVQKFSTTFFPNPSILNASFETKCFSFSFNISLQLKFESGHLVIASFFLVLVLNS